MKQSLLLKTRDLIHRESRLPFSKQIDLYEVEDGILCGVTGALGQGFRLEGRDLLLESDLEIDDLERRARKFLNSLPQGSMLHFIVRTQEGDESILQSYADSVESRNPLSEKITQSRIAVYRKKPFLKKEIFLFVVIYPRTKKSHSSFLPSLSLAFGKKAKRLSAGDYRLAKDALLSISEEVKEGFGNLGFNLLPLQDAEVLRYLYELLNHVYSKDIPFQNQQLERKSDQFEAMSLRSRLLFSTPIIGERFFYLGGLFYKAINLCHCPEESDLKVMKDFEKELGKDYLLSMTVQVADQEKEKAGIQRQGNFSKAEMLYSKTKQHDAQAKAGQSDELLTELAETGDKLFAVWFAVLVKDKTLEGVEKRAREVLRSFPRLGGARGIEDHMNHDRIFLSCLPLQGDDNPLPALVRTEILIHLLPLQASWRGTDKFGLLLKTYRDEPLRLDLFDPALAAKHGVMLGSTGSGKSFFTNHLLLHFFIESLTHEVIVIDVGGSYRKLAKILEGSYLEVECSEEYALNPFPRKGILFPEGREADTTFLQFLKELLQKMIAPSRIWLASEKMILERAIRAVYVPLNEESSPLLGDLEKALRHFQLGDEEDQKKAYQFAKELVLYTEGEYGKILNRKGVFNFEARFTVFDLRKIAQYPELQEILLLIIPFALKRKFENLAIKKILVLDECWQLLKESQGTELVEVFYRTARKMNAGVLSISQNPEDFLESEISSVIINNSPIKYILRLKKGHEQLSSFGLNENEIKAVGELEVRPGHYSETFIKFDDHSVIVKLEPGPLDYWIATTDALDAVEESRIRLANRKLTEFEILERLAHEFPHGVKKAEALQHAA